MQRRTFIIGTVGLTIAPAIAMAETGWSEPMAIRFASGSAELGASQQGELEAVVKAFQARPNPHNGDWVRVTGYMDQAERSQFLRELPLQRANAVAEAFENLEGARGRTRPRRGTSLLVQKPGPLAENRVVLLSWPVSS
ncbi:hypothetical protein SGCZBJ_12175 [Caulobacter zeae]|uniref:OmpA-like domain-containing protein n=2 Tax=Caulobacter zeae TaxID=2055137 RepID=A0A2N5DFZ1_9CAUL|nr:hypothetical protein SGCZBJ_12175 [Caulobacter zeae]